MVGNIEILLTTDAKYFTVVYRGLKTLYIIYCEDVACDVWELFRTVISPTREATVERR